MTPLRKQREYKDSLRGDYTVDFEKIKRKARMKRQITTKQNTYITHLRDEHSLHLMQQTGDTLTEEQQHLDPKKLQKQQQTKMNKKTKGKEAIMKELEAIKKQRLAQKRFLKTEYVERELMLLSYNLLEHLHKMRKCTFVAESVKSGKYGTLSRVRYYCTRDGKQIHELYEQEGAAASTARDSTTEPIQSVK